MHTHDGSAEDLLHEIPSESLQQVIVGTYRREWKIPDLSLQSQLLCQVRCATRKPALTRIASIDSYLIASTSRRGSSGDVFQVHGTPGSGKTHMLYFFLATCTMPTSFGGWNKAAFVYDIDGHFSVSRFRDIVMCQLQESSLSGSVISLHIENCLKLMHIFRPTSSDQLAVSLAHLPLYHSKHFPDFELGLIAIHSLDAFYWIDRYHTEQARTSPGYSLSPKLASILDKVQRLYGMFVLLSVWGLPQRSRWTSPADANDPSSLDCENGWHQISLQHTFPGSQRVERIGSVQSPGHGEAAKFDFRIARPGLLFEL